MNREHRLPTSWTRSAAEVMAALESLRSDQPVRKVVTREGGRPRGNTPGTHAVGKLTYESFNERHGLELLDRSSLVSRVATRPWVLKLKSSPPLSYTPDVFIHLSDTAGLVELKGDIFLHSDEQVDRYYEIDRLLKEAGVPFFLILSSDLKKANLQDELAILRRMAPDPLGYRSRQNAVERVEPTPALTQRLADAVRACDQLLLRLMSRTSAETVAMAAIHRRTPC